MELKFESLAKICLVAFAFLLAFSIGAQLTQARIRYENEPNPVRDYLRKNYGVDSIEEYEAKIMQQAWLNYSQTLQQLDVDEWLNQLKQYSFMPRFGTSTYQQLNFQTQTPSWFNLALANPLVELSIFSLSGIGFLAVMFTPFVKNHKRLKYALALAFVCFIVFGVGFFTGQIYAQSGSHNIYLDVLPSTASYVIETDGTYVWATRYDGYLAYGGSTNRGGVSGTDASAVIQAAINALGTVGGKIFIKAGVYNLSSPIGWAVTADTNAAIDIIGEGASTILQQYPTRTTPLIQIKTTSGNIRRIRIANLHLKGGTKGIELQNAAYNIFENLYFIGQSQWGIDDLTNSVINKFSRIMMVHMDGGGIRLRGPWNMIEQCNFGEDIKGNAVQLESNYNIVANSFFRPNSDVVGVYLTGSFNIIIGNTVYDCLRGVSLYSNGNVVAFNNIYNTKREGIAVWHFTAGSFYADNRIIGNAIWNTGLDPAWTEKNGITLNRAQRTIVAFNRIFDVPSYSIRETALAENDYNDISYNIVAQSIYKYGLNTKVKGNVGYYTENFKATGVSVPIGTGGVYGSAVAITSPSGRITYPRVKITWGGTFAAGETVTVKVEAVYTGGTTAYVEKSATATGSQWLTDDDILALITQGKDIVKLNLYAKTSAASTTVAVTVDACGKG